MRVYYICVYTGFTLNYPGYTPVLWIYIRKNARLRMSKEWIKYKVIMYFQQRIANMINDDSCTRVSLLGGRRRCEVLYPLRRQISANQRAPKSKANPSASRDSTRVFQNLLLSMSFDSKFWKESEQKKKCLNQAQLTATEKYWCNKMASSFSMGAGIWPLWRLGITVTEANRFEQKFARMKLNKYFYKDFTRI